MPGMRVFPKLAAIGAACLAWASPLFGQSVDMKPSKTMPKSHPTAAAARIDSNTTSDTAVIGRDTPAKPIASSPKLPLGGGTFHPTPLYAGELADSAMSVVVGSHEAPTVTAGAAGVFEKFAKSHASNALAGIAYKYGGNYEDRTTGIYGEAADKVGGFGSFVEGMRGQGTLVQGSAGAAYGVICSAGIDPVSGARDFRLLTGCEGEVDNTIGPDAPTFEAFSRDHFAISFVASNGVGNGKRYKADAAFWTNSYSLAQFQTGFLCSAAIADTCMAATKDTVAKKGIDLSLATLSYAAIIVPNNAPIRFADAAGAARLNVLNVDRANVLQVGTESASVNVPAALTANSYGVGKVAGVSCAAGKVNLATLVVTNGIITHC